MHQNREKRGKKHKNFTGSNRRGELNGRGWPGNPLAGARPPFLREFRPTAALRPDLSAEDRWWGRVGFFECAVASGLYKCPDFLGFEGHVNACDAEGSESVEDGVDDGGRRGNRASFAYAFRAQRIDG